MSTTYRAFLDSVKSGRIVGMSYSIWIQHQRFLERFDPRAPLSPQGSKGGGADLKSGAATRGGWGGCSPPSFFPIYRCALFSKYRFLKNAYFPVSIIFSNAECFHNNDFIPYLCMCAFFLDKYALFLRIYSFLVYIFALFVHT